MKAIKGPLALSLCCILYFPSAFAQQLPEDKPLSRRGAGSRHQTAQLRGDDRIVHALNRFTFGSRPGDLTTVRSIGLEKWFNQQLHPASIDQANLNVRLAQFPDMQWSTEDLLYRLPSNGEIRQAMNTGRVPIPESGTLHAIYENQIYRLQAKKEQKAQKTAGGDTSPAAMSTANRPAAASEQMGMNGADAQPAFDDAAIRQILALQPEQRVARLAAMQPAEFESFIKSLRPLQRVALNADLNPQLKLTVAALENPERLVAEDLVAQRLTRDIYSNAQLEEVMTDFWLNHFNVFLRKNEQMPYYLVSYERDTIRPRALGKFEDLLEAVAHSPAMLVYLDNAQSIGPDSVAALRADQAEAHRPTPKKNLREGLNENYARELMELHTLGVNGGYTQADVTQVARVLTGWTVDRPLVGATFTFNANRHEPGAKQVLGTKIKENGENEGRELLHMLAMSPATAQFISRKLAVRFVSDDPPKALVDRMAKSYLASGGDIPAVLKTLFHSSELWSTSTYLAKVKTPLEFVVSSARASNANIDSVLPLANNLRQMGMPVYGAVPPTGYDWKSSTWVSTGALVDRMNFALNLAANRLPGVTITWAALPELAGSSPNLLTSIDLEEARLEPLLIPGGASESTRAAALKQFEVQSAQAGMQGAASVRPVAIAGTRMNKAPNATALEKQDQLLAGLLMGSPDFQRR